MIFASFLALLSTIIGSFSGGGSSLILFPLMLMFFNDTYISLLIVSKISAVVMTFAASRLHFKKISFDFKLMLFLTIGGLMGTAFGTYLLQYRFNEILFERFLAIILIIVGLYIFFSKKTGVHDGKKDFGIKILLISAVFSFFINVLNGMFGGTGIFLTIYLVSVLKMNFIRAIAYTMFNYAILSSSQVVYLAITENFNIKLALAVIIGATLGGSLGTHLQYLKGSLWVKRAAVVMLLAIGTKMLLG